MPRPKKKLNMNKTTYLKKDEFGRKNVVEIGDLVSLKTPFWENSRGYTYGWVVDVKRPDNISNLTLELQRIKRAGKVPRNIYLLLFKPRYSGDGAILRMSNKLNIKPKYSLIEIEPAIEPFHASELMLITKRGWLWD